MLHESTLSSELSQGNFEATPRDGDEIVKLSTHSPLRKKGKPSHLSTRHGTTLFNMAVSQSQDFSYAPSLSQSSYSQDVVDRLGQLSCKLSQEDSNMSNASTSNYVLNFHTLPSTDTNSIPASSGGSNTFTLFNIPLMTPRPRSSSPVTTASAAPPNTSITEKKLTIPPPIANPFTGVQPKNTRRHTTIWLHPYRERPRYLIDFDQEGVLGEGSFSVVYAARKRLDGSLYAIKKLKRSVVSESDGNSMLREACALSVLQDCPHIIRYYSCWMEDSHLWLQTELCLRVTMDSYIPRSPSVTRRRKFSFDSEDSGNATPMMTPTAAVCPTMDFPVTPSASPCVFSEKVFWITVRTVCAALQFMHQRKMAHLDIRPANLFLCATSIHDCSSESAAHMTDRIEKGDWIIKLGDFGLCCRLDEQNTYTEGDARYCARELITGMTSPSSEIDFAKADMFSLGASLLEMSTGAPLAAGGEESGNWQRIRSGGVTVPNYFSVDAQQLVEKVIKFS